MSYCMMVGRQIHAVVSDYSSIYEEQGEAPSMACVCTASANLDTVICAKRPAVALLLGISCTGTGAIFTVGPAVFSLG